jgi:hypothetical protein
MESFKDKQLKSQLDRVFGNSPQGEEMKRIVYKAQTTGYTEEEIEAYKKQKEDEVKAFNDFFGTEPPQPCVPSEVIVGKIFSNEILDDNTSTNTNDNE